VEALVRERPGLASEWLRGLARRHGSLAAQILGMAQSPEDLGRHFGGGLTAREIDYLIEREWAVNAEDVLYRRTKAGLHMTAAERGAVELYLKAKV
jgi:glycerol-3-phosphate dehydrogenase